MHCGDLALFYSHGSFHKLMDIRMLAALTKRVSTGLLEYAFYCL